MKKTKVRVMDANIPLRVEIKPEDVKKAKPGDMDHCVVAQAIQRQLGTSYVCVGKKIVSVFKNDVIVRFMTPHKIASNLAIFDKTGCWSLPAGIYEFRPPSPAYTIKARIADTNKRRPKSHVKVTKTKGKPIRFTTLRALHSRKSSGFKAAMKKSKLHFVAA